MPQRFEVHDRGGDRGGACERRGESPSPEAGAGSRPARCGIVVTGIGCATPVGLDAPSFWEGLLAGRQGAGPIRSFDARPYRSGVGCEVRGLEIPPELEESVLQARALSRPGSSAARWTAPRAALLAVVAGREALGRAGLSPRALGARIGISLGSTMGEPTFLDAIGGRLEAASEDVPWEELVGHSPWTTTALAARALGIAGIQSSTPAACSAGNYAIGLAYDLLRAGSADVMLAGGAEAFSESAFAGFQRLGAMSADLCRPFDRDRQGLLLGEGAGVLVLEREDHARRRGARPLARVLGYGLSCDAHHITGPHPEGRGAREAMQLAIADAGASPEDVDYISCHGTGTVQNDRIEARAIHAVFGERARSVPASSIKALTGHLMGAASAVEAIACVLAIAEGTLPPTWNHRELDPECPLDVIPNEPRSARPRLVLNNSYAFGGNNACVAFGAG